MGLCSSPLGIGVKDHANPAFWQKAKSTNFSISDIATWSRAGEHLLSPDQRPQAWLRLPAAPRPFSPTGSPLKRAERLAAGVPTRKGQAGAVTCSHSRAGHQQEPPRPWEKARHSLVKRLLASGLSPAGPAAADRVALEG